MLAATLMREIFGCWICILVGRGDVLDLVWVVSSDGENIGRVTTLQYYLHLEYVPLSCYM